MPSLDWQCRQQGGVTLVELVVTASREQRVRIDSRLEPVWPPRRQGVPVSGWDGTGFEGRVTPDSPLVVGYASPAAPVEPPARLGTPAPDEPRPSNDSAVTGSDVVRALGECAPPRDAVPTAGNEPGGAGTDGWIEAVQRRLDEAEALAAASGVGEAREAIDAVGGIEAARRLQAQLDTDRRHLRQRQEQYREIEAQLAAVDVPLSTLERVG